MHLDVLGDTAFEQGVALLDGAAGGFDHEGFGHFAFAVRGDADDDAVVYRGVGEEVGF